MRVSAQTSSAEARADTQSADECARPLVTNLFVPAHVTPVRRREECSTASQPHPGLHDKPPHGDCTGGAAARISSHVNSSNLQMVLSPCAQRFAPVVMTDGAAAYLVVVPLGARLLLRRERCAAGQHFVYLRLVRRVARVALDRRRELCELRRAGHDRLNELPRRGHELQVRTEVATGAASCRQTHTSGHACKSDRKHRANRRHTVHNGRRG